MRIARATSLLLLFGGAQAFITTAPSSFGVVRQAAAFVRPLGMSEESSSEEPVVVEPPVVVEEPKQTSGLHISQVRKTISKLSTDSFSTDLATMEDFLLNEAGSTFYAKSMKRIAQKAKELGTSVPEGYAVQAKATAKRRAKQNEFIQAKEEERLAAEAEAADAQAVEEPVEAETNAEQKELVAA